jgi:hypothetical protein
MQLQQTQFNDGSTVYYPTENIILPREEIQEFKNYCIQLLGVGSISTQRHPENHSQRIFHVGITRNKERIIERLLQDQKISEISGQYFHKGMLVKFSDGGQIGAC